MGCHRDAPNRASGSKEGLGASCWCIKRGSSPSSLIPRSSCCPPDGYPARAAGASPSQRDGKEGQRAHPRAMWAAFRVRGEVNSLQGCISPQKPPHPAAWILVSFFCRRSTACPRVAGMEPYLGKSVEYPNYRARHLCEHWLLFDTALTRRTSSWRHSVRVALGASGVL